MNTTRKLGLGALIAVSALAIGSQAEATPRNPPVRQPPEHPTDKVFRPRENPHRLPGL